MQRPTRRTVAITGAAARMLRLTPTTIMLASSLAVIACMALPSGQAQTVPIAPPFKPIPVEPGATPAQPQLIQASNFIRVNDARAKFKVDGDGITVAVLDSGIFSKHLDFGEGARIVAVRNFTQENGGNAANATDVYGHGTHVAGIIGANGTNVGMAPKIRFVVAKVLDNAGSGSWEGIRDGLDWVLQNADTHKISVVNVSIGAFRNFTDDNTLATSVGSVGPQIRERFQQLRKRNIAVVVAAGNAYGVDQKPGMDFPGICRETVSAGAVFDAAGGALPPFKPNAIAKSRKAGQITPFSQRLHESVNAALRTDIFAPGSPITSTGLGAKDAQSTQNGTSQATPITAGVIALMQQLFRTKHPGALPTVDNLEKWLREGSEEELDGDNEDDNVAHTDKKYRRIDALKALEVTAKAIGLP
jgi:subtilisin family serine protease